MAKIAPDYTFVRDGAPLSEWLWRLLSDDRAQRDAADNALQAMCRGLSDPSTDLLSLDPIPDFAGQSRRFAQAVRETVAGPGFDTVGFVTKLCEYLVSTSEERTRRLEAIRSKTAPAEEQFERLAERINRKIDAASDDTLRQRLEKRLSRIVSASIDRDLDLDIAREQQEIAASTPVSAHVVFKAMDQAFLAAPEALMLVLDHELEGHAAVHALERIGPPAKSFAPALIKRMDRLIETDVDSRHYDAAPALASIGRDDAGIVDAMIQRLNSNCAAIRIGAAQTLARMETHVAGRTGAILPLLHRMLDRTDQDMWAAIDALASVGRNDPESRHRIIELAGPRPPRLSEPYYQDYRQDLTMSERGMAIDAMRYFIEYPDPCIPVLIGAIESFEEYDPDETYSGPVGRVSRAIKHFGPRAGNEAAVALARHLSDDEDDFPKAILQALEAIGPEASEALPLLEEFRRISAGGESLPDLDAAESDKDFYPVGWVIRRIRGD